MQSMQSSEYAQEPCIEEMGKSPKLSLSQTSLSDAQDFDPSQQELKPLTMTLSDLNLEP